MSRARGALEARSISKAFGDTVVLDRVSLAVTPGSRIGVVGPNGIGKSTLLRVLAGLEQPDSGTLSLEPPGLAVAYLAQVPDLADRSGGEAARAQLEAILASDVDVLLLDEPTNDLDFAGLELLDRFLDRHRGGLVAVSHDRAFLERMTRIVEFEAETRRVREYPGGWSAFEAERSRSAERQQGDYRRYVDERDRIRGASPHDAPVGGARLRAGSQEEEVEGRRQALREEARPPRTRREAVVALAAGARPHAGTAGRRRRRTAGASRGRARGLPARPARPRGS